MKPFVACLVAVSAMVVPAAHAAAPSHPAPAYVEGKVLVKYRPGVATGQVIAKRGLGLRSVGTFLGGRLEALELPAMTTVAQTLPALRADPAIEYAEPDYIRYFRAAAVPNDPLFNQQWGLYSTGQANFVTTDPQYASIPGDDMHMLAAWDPAGDGTFPRAGNGSATVAIIDDSVLISHPDLAPNLVPGFDFLHNDTNPSPDPNSDQGHGTMVAGCIGAVGNNGGGVAGVAWNVKLMPLKIGLGSTVSGATSSSQFIAAMDYARTHGANIINASFGGPEYSQAEADGLAALAAADILFVAAAGNDDSNTDVAQISYPANYPIDNIVSVAATNRQDNIASFSQYGARTVDIAAPGFQVITTSNSGYLAPPGASGTSFASPYTAGVAALLKMQNPSATYHELKARLLEGADPAGAVNRRTMSGRLNAANSLDIAARPAIVLTGASWDGNQVLDPGETTQLAVTLQNLWLDATNVSVTLTADNGITSSSGSVAFGNLAGQASATRSFTVTVPAGITGHRYVDFKLAVTADNGYSAERHFIDEIGALGDTQITQSFAPFDQDLYDEFHAWHYTLGALPAGHNQLVIETTAPADLDLLVKKDVPPRYDIKVGVDPESSSAMFCTSDTTPSCQDPDLFLSAGPSGNEQVVIDNPQPGATYHIVIVNFAQLQGGMDYTLKASTRAKPVPASGGGGGGALGLSFLPLVLVAALRRRRS